MTDINYSMMLRQLVNDYFDQRIDRVEYFTQRRDILDRIDLDFNGEHVSEGWQKAAANFNDKHVNDNDVTQPQDITRPNPLG